MTGGPSAVIHYTVITDRKPMRKTVKVIEVSGLPR